MNITADQIQSISIGTRVLNQDIKSILKTFQSEIVEAGKNGATQVIVAVPTNFNIVNMNHTTAQTIIYHKLIEELENNGFSVKINMSDSGITYCIGWEIEHDNSDIVEMQHVIAKHMIKKKKKTSLTK